MPETREMYVITFIDYLEEFIQAVIWHHAVSDTKTATILNKKRRALEEHIMELAGIKTSNEENETLEEFKCPECNSDMKIRTNKTTSEKFWGCIKYPSCRGTRDSVGLSKYDRKKEEVEHQDGFSFNRDKRSPATEVSPPVDTGWVNPFSKK